MSETTKDPTPAAPGKPRIKGLAVINLVAAMKGARPDAASAVPEDLRSYLQGRVLVSSWYAEEDHFRLLEILARWLERPGKDVWAFLGRKNAEIDLGGIYSAMVLKGRPKATMMRASKLWRLYRDTGDHRVELEESGGCRAILRDYAFAGPEVAAMVGGYYGELNRRAGAATWDVTSTSTGTGPDAVMEWRISWDR